MSILLLFFLSLSVAEASFGSKCMRYMTEVRDLMVASLTYKFPESTLKGQDWELVLGKELGAGVSGSAYRVKKLSYQFGAEVEQTEVIAKLPHCWRWNGKVINFCQLQIADEIWLLHEAERDLNKLEELAEYPPDAPWARGQLPVIPILDELDTFQGTILIKPLIKGKSTKQLKELYGKELNAEIIESLHDIWSFQAAYARLGKDIDINPSNLMWIEDPKLLDLFHYKKPGFILFEIGLFPNKKLFPKGFSFEEFLNMVQDVN